MDEIERMKKEAKRCPFCCGEAIIETVDCDDVSFWKVSCNNPMCLLFNSKLYEQLEAENKRLYDALNEIVNRNDFSRCCDGSLLDAVIADYDIQVDGVPLIKIAQRALKEVNRK